MPKIEPKIERARITDWISVALVCGFVFSIAFLARPHGATYGPPPYFYNTDLTLWISLAEHPLSALPGHVLANRPLFAYLGWAFARPIRWIIGASTVANPKRSGGTATADLATVGGLLLANFACYVLVSLLLYEQTRIIANGRASALLAAILWATSSFAFAWSYHPVNQMGGLLVVFAFCLGLYRVTPNAGLLRHALLGLGIGVLLLMKAYYVFPFIYVVWGLVRKIPILDIAVAFVLFFIPTVLWHRAYELLTGHTFVDYHLGSGGILGFLGQKLTTVEGIGATLADLVVGLANLPAVALNPTGLFVGALAAIFCISRSYRRQYPVFLGFASIYLPLIFLFLILSGRCSEPGGDCFFIPRHGSDFFPVVFPAAGIVMYDLWRASSVRRRFLLVAALVCVTLVTYTHEWLQAANCL